jgi:hypothetical protein
VLHPSRTISAGLGVITTIAFGLPTLAVDMVLLCRVIAVVPPSTTSKRVIAAVYTFPILSKVARLALVVAFGILNFRDLSRGDKHYGSSEVEARIMEAAWILNVLDNACALPSSPRAAY